MVPSTLQLLGRSALENDDICGAYVHAGWAEGRATYLQVGRDTALTFRRGLWVIDRNGLGGDVMGVAWAKDHGHLSPAGLGPWHVWSSAANDFLADSKLTLLDAPNLTLLGRSDIQGEYRFEGLCHGRPCYAKGGLLIRYHEGRWLIAGKEHKGSSCIAYAESQDTPHPGFACLKWHLWNGQGQSGQWSHDPNCHCLDAPSVIQVLGRHANACNARICGTYHLAGLREGRPLYLLPGKRAVIRYASETDRWLIDFDALAEPGILGRILQWALNTPNACSAWAEARGSSHPGHLDLEWHVWETAQNRAVLDAGVRATLAPQKLQVIGRGPEEENGDMSGEYFLVGLHKGWPAYQQKGRTMAIRREKNRWLIDREGFRDSMTCVAYAAATPGFQHPADGGSQRWRVYESRSQGHSLDFGIKVVADEVTGEEPSAKRQRKEPSLVVNPSCFGA